MLRTICAIAVALAVVPGCKKSETPSGADEAKAIERAVTEAMKAGFEKNDVDAYLSVWADDASLTGGRGETPGPYDVTLDRKQIEATKRLIASMPRSVSMVVRFEDVKVDVKGDEAEMRCRTVVEMGTDSMEKVGEIYRLAKTKDGWRIKSNRYWLLDTRYGDKEQAHDAAAWKKLDAAVEEAKTKDDREALVYALLDAWRLEEALKEARVLVKERPDSAANMGLYASLARLTGNADEALEVYRRIHAKWPDAPVPSLAKDKDQGATAAPPR